MALNWNSVQAGVDAVSGAMDSVASTDVSQFVSDSSNYWDMGVEFATSAFGWLDDTADWVQSKPEAAKMLAGVAGGVGQYLSARDERKFQEEMFEKQQAAQKIVPGNYDPRSGATNTSITNGLITNGIIANRKKDRFSKGGAYAG